MNGIFDLGAKCHVQGGDRIFDDIAEYMEARIEEPEALNKVVRQPIRSQPAVKWTRILKGADLRMAGASQVLRHLDHAVADGAWLRAISAPARGRPARWY